MAGNLLDMLGRAARRLHRDERGADMLEYILIVAAVALPLLAVVVWFWSDLKEWAMGLWEKSKGKVEEGMPE